MTPHPLIAPAKAAFTPRLNARRLARRMIFIAVAMLSIACMAFLILATLR